MDEQVLLAVATSIISSSVTAAIIGAIFKRIFDNQIEVRKAYLSRESKVHEQQVTALRLIHANLKRSNHFFQRLSAALKLPNETDEVLYKDFNKFIVAASDLYLDNELLIPESIVAQLDAFFAKLQSAQIDLGFAMSPEFPSGEARAKLFDKAATAAFQELPAILKEINTAARAIIHILTDKSPPSLLRV